MPNWKKVITSGSDASLNTLQLTNLGSQNETLIVGTANQVTSSNILALDTINKYLGINQSNPEVTLHMTGEDAQTAQIRMEQYNDSADAPDVRTRRYRGTIDSPSAINSGDYLFRSNHEYWNGSALIVGGAFAFDNTNNAERTQFAVSVTTDGTSADPANASKVQFKIDGNDGGAITFNNAYKFPTTDGSINQVLQTNGSGVLSFADVAGGSSVWYDGITYITSSADVQITGSLQIYKSGSTVFNIEGSQGTLFTVTDELSGSLFSVNDISGIPIFEVFSDNTVKIGTYSAEGIEVQGSDVKITGSLAVGNISPNATDGRIDASNDVVAFSSSDKRWKTNIKQIESPLEKLQKLSGVEFDWIEDWEVHGNGGNDVGVIAQEVELVLPQAVQTRDSGMKAVRYEKLIPLLIETIKEQQKQIDELKNKIG